MCRVFCRVVTLCSVLSFSHVVASEYEADDCLLERLLIASGDLTISELKEQCDAAKVEPELGAISKRLAQERDTQLNPYVITPHRMNYILPLAKSDNLNRDIYSGVESFASRLEDTEVKFQLSFKIPLSRDEIFVKHDGFYFGITIKSLWQLYADNISAPFRETNYRPELFYLMPLNWGPGEGNTGLVFGVEHESNGRTIPLSRSWNRAYINFLYEWNNLALSLKPWYRFDEDDKQGPLDPGGDDNPDIEDYMGRFEFAGAYQWDDYEFNFMTRRNFSTERGAVELGLTFPLWGRVRGYVQYFDGYGESLIDYNHKQQRIGIGFALTDML